MLWSETCLDVGCLQMDNDDSTEMESLFQLVQSMGMLNKLLNRIKAGPSTVLFVH